MRVLLQIVIALVITFLVTAILLIQIGIVESPPLDSWDAFRTYVVDRAQPRWIQVQRLIWPIQLMPPAQPDRTGPAPTLANLWTGEATFVVELEQTGLPMGESDTIVLRDGTLWSYVHASDRSAGVRDACGEPVPFPGCVVVYESDDQGKNFALNDATCLTTCLQCPCGGDTQVDQQQYPRVDYDGRLLHLVYEYRGMVMHRTSEDGLRWEAPTFVPNTGFWAKDFQSCPFGAAVNPHPYTSAVAECLVGGPPGLYIEGEMIYIFVGMGQNPGAMGCYYGRIDTPLAQLQACVANPLFVGASEYGPEPEQVGSAESTNAYFDFRTISSAEVQRIGDRYYMLYEGVRGPGPGDPGDTQFGLGLARSNTAAIDGPWERFPNNPLLLDLPGNIGVGHADLVVLNGVTYLYTSLDGVTRSRLILQWTDKQP